MTSLQGIITVFVILQMCLKGYRWDRDKGLPDGFSLLPGPLPLISCHKGS